MWICENLKDFYKFVQSDVYRQTFWLEEWLNWIWLGRFHLYFGQWKYKFTHKTVLMVETFDEFTIDASSSPDITQLSMRPKMRLPADQTDLKYWRSWRRWCWPCPERPAALRSRQRTCSSSRGCRAGKAVAMSLRPREHETLRYFQLIMVEVVQNSPKTLIGR